MHSRGTKRGVARARPFKVTLLRGREKVGGQEPRGGMWSCRREEVLLAVQVSSLSPSGRRPPTCPRAHLRLTPDPLPDAARSVPCQCSQMLPLLTSPNFKDQKAHQSGSSACLFKFMVQRKARTTIRVIDTPMERLTAAKKFFFVKYMSVGAEVFKIRPPRVVSPSVPRASSNSLQPSSRGPQASSCFCFCFFSFKPLQVLFACSFISCFIFYFISKRFYYSVRCMNRVVLIIIRCVFCFLESLNTWVDFKLSFFSFLTTLYCLTYLNSHKDCFFWFLRLLYMCDLFL